MRFALGAVLCRAALACAGTVSPTAQPTAPPSLHDMPTAPPATLDPNGGLCRLLARAEVTDALDVTVDVTEAAPESCTYADADSSATLNVRIEHGDMALNRSLLGDTAADITVGALSGVSGSFVGSPIVYVEREDEQLVLQGVLLAGDEAGIAKIVELAIVAAGRW